MDDQRHRAPTGGRPQGAAPLRDREITELGFGGSRLIVDRYVRTLREQTAPAERARPIPSPREITSWIMRPRDRPARDDIDRLDQVRLACPDITAVCDLARTFHDLMGARRAADLGQWVRLAERDGSAPLRGFAGFLRQDWGAVLAAFTLSYSSGSTEGNVNRLKTIERAMYGRASFRLLRARVLATSPQYGPRVHARSGPMSPAEFDPWQTPASTDSDAPAP